MPVLSGKVTARELVVEVEGRQHFLPKGCDPIIGPHLEKLSGQTVEVLMAKDTVLAIRPKDRELRARIPIITCYLCPPDVVFRHDILEKIAPIITESLVESGYLATATVEELGRFARS